MGYNLRNSKFLPNFLGDFKMNKLLLSVILTMGIALVSAPVMAKHGADDPAGHDATEHGGGHDATEHGGGHDATEHAGGHDANEHAAGHDANEAAEHAAGHDVNDDDTPAPAPAI